MPAHAGRSIREGPLESHLAAVADSRRTVVHCNWAYNRRLVGELREALGSEWSTPLRATLRALRRGEPLAGSGVVLL